jgi:protein TonB
MPKRGVLIESGRRRSRSPLAAFGSVVVHAGCIALALHLTAGAMSGSVARDVPQEHVVHVALAPHPAAPRPRPTTVAKPSVAPPRDQYQIQVNVASPAAAPIVLSAIPAHLDIVAQRELASQPASTGPSGEGDGEPDVFTADQVDLTVALVEGSFGPPYPAELRDTHPDGTVLARFVVDTTGRVEIPTLKIVMTSAPAFADAVRDALPQLHFTAARYHGRKVRVRIEQIFQFGCSC